MKKAIGISTAVLVVTLAYLFRYDVDASATANNRPIAYVLDRWTGNMTVCVYKKCSDVEDRDQTSSN